MRRLVPGLTLVLSLAPIPAAMAAEPGEPVAAEVVVAAPIQTVWDAFTTREGMESWVEGKFSEIRIDLGETWRSSYEKSSNLDDDTVIETEVLAFDPGRMLAARTVKAPADFPFPHAILHTWYVVYLEPVDATHTRVVHRMFGFTGDDESQKMREFFEWGNQYELDRLAGIFGGEKEPPPGR